MSIDGVGRPRRFGALAPTAPVEVQVRHGERPNQPFEPLPAPTGRPPFRVELADVLGAAAVDAIRAGGQLSFHVVLSDVLCGVGVTDAALGAGKAIRDQAEDQVQRGMPRLGPALPRVPLRRSRDRLAGLLPEDALQDALEGLGPEEITGPGGLMTQLAGRVIEAALGAELSEHLGYPPGQAPPGGAGNHRNGSTAKTLKTELGEVRGPYAARPPGDV